MTTKRTGRDRTYEGLVSKLPPHAVTKLAADLTRRLFNADSETTRPSPAELGACARAVGALPPKEREHHAKVLGRVRDVLFASSILPPALGLFGALLTAKMGEVVALTEAKLAVATHRALVAVRAKALRAEGHEELATEHDLTLAALDQQLALLAERLAVAEAESVELMTADFADKTIDEARALEAALGIDLAPQALLGVVDALHSARERWDGAVRPQLKRLLDLVNDAEGAAPRP